MKRIFPLIGMLALAGAFFVGCDKVENITTGPGGLPGGPGGTPADLALARQFPPLLANGTDEIEVNAIVVDGSGRGLANVGVLFTTTRGTIVPFATTDAGGSATTTLTSEASSTDITATITAVAVADTSNAPAIIAGTKTAEAPVGAVVLISRAELSPEQVQEALAARPGAPGLELAGATAEVTDQTTIKMKGLTVTLVASPGTIPADGLSSSRIIANLIETTSRIPVAAQTIRFGATAGTITGSASTGTSGSAEATLTGLTSGATSTITAFYGNQLTAQTTVTFSALSLSVRSVAAIVSADGVSTTEIVATLINAERNPVTGARVDFSTTLGNVTSPVLTNAQGEARALLRAGSTAGTAAVTARFSGLNQAVNVTFSAPPTTSSVLVALNPSSIPADGLSQAEVSAIALDGSNNPMPDGTLVTFSIQSGGGTLIAPASLTTGGRARATYVASTTPGPINIRAVSGSASGTRQLTLTPLEAGSITLTSSQASIIADGLNTTNLSATVRDNFGNPVAAGTSVTFATNLGAIEAVTPTSASGTATARLRAGRFETGTARVTARAALAVGAVDVKFASEGADHIVIIELDRPTIGVRGSGAPETSTLTFEVRDRSGIPVDIDHQATVNFTIVPSSANDAVLSFASTTTNDRGRALAIVRSGTVSGAIEVQAAIGSIVSKPIRVVIHGDLPDPAHFSVSFERLNIAGLVFDGIRNGVTARVGDQHGNPVPDSTSVWFSAAYGLIQGSAFTDDHGEATVWEVTAAPRPAIPGGDGLVLLTAQTVSKAGNLMTTSGNVMWSGPTILEITSPVTFAIPNGGSQVILFRVRDANNNPLTGGTSVSAETTVGQLGGNVDSVVPDTQDPSFTFFSVTLSDDETDENDPPVSVTVTIRVRSQNGDRDISITGTLD